MTFSFSDQIEIISGHQGLFWYSLVIDHLFDDISHLFNEFIRSDNFSVDCRPLIVKNDSRINTRYLDSAFNYDRLSMSDFKFLSKYELLNFFDDYGNDDNWGDDRPDFKVILNKFETLLIEEISEEYLLISKEWFDKDDVLLSVDSNVYLYYFLIIWIDQNKKMIKIIQWKYD